MNPAAARYLYGLDAHLADVGDIDKRICLLEERKMAGRSAGARARRLGRLRSQPCAAADAFFGLRSRASSWRPHDSPGGRARGENPQKTFANAAGHKFAPNIRLKFKQPFDHFGGATG
jgi:hypothetical protein